ncbi:hypothetical protein [Parapedobacter sp. 2B3]|uniref:hypothetical protein n=1 Tax=Parapedobacter sp. 2B3 TaxID=3342381 RepID=UPI0035B61AE1
MRALQELIEILLKYTEKFGLEPIDVAYLSKVNRKTIDALLAGTGGIELESVDEISLIFGLRYYQLGNPDFEMPFFDSLPETTKDRIAFRKKEGPHEDTTYNAVLLNEKITVVLNNYKKDDEFLAEHIVKSLSETFKENFSTSEVGKRLTESMDDYIIKTTRQDRDRKGRGPKPFYFKLVRRVPPKVLKEAKDKIAEVNKDNVEKKVVKKEQNDISES